MGPHRAFQPQTFHGSDREPPRLRVGAVVVMSQELEVLLMVLHVRRVVGVLQVPQRRAGCPPLVPVRNTLDLVLDRERGPTESDHLGVLPVAFVGAPRCPRALLGPDVELQRPQRGNGLLGESLQRFRNVLRVRHIRLPLTAAALAKRFRERRRPCFRETLLVKGARLHDAALPAAPPGAKSAPSFQAFGYL
eukprot:9504001-Pyramimonas_sp.AAC.5